MTRNLWRSFAILVTLSAGGHASAFSGILDEWENTYPDSTSNALECQLCHANSFGGSPWNAYGWDIRKSINDDGLSRAAAIRAAEGFDLDNDRLGIESFDEIIRHFQPGWRDGANTVFDRDGNTSIVDNPPTPPAQTAIDFPTAAEVLDDPIVAAISNSPTSIELEEIARDYDKPVKAVRAPGIDGSLFVVEQTGKIFRTDLASGEKTLFFDAGGNLDNCNECGLLSLAFHPNYAVNRLFYTYQSEPLSGEVNDFPVALPDHVSKIVEYRAADASCNSRITKRRTLLTVEQPDSNHNGGDLEFDNNGFLYISLGDGGGASDFGAGHGVLGNGRDNTNILGSILKIDPLGTNSSNGKYGIPGDNPFNGSAGVDEIYAFGFRNPYRISFDANTGELYAADVGQNEIEEIDNVISGGNYGWNWKEGSFFFYYFPIGSNTTRFVSNVAPPNLPQNLIDPVGEYDHDEGISITGGYVYRGDAIDTIADSNRLFGKYVFADLIGGLFELNTDNGIITKFEVAGGLPDAVTGFGQDADNELYIVTRDNTDSLFKLVETGDAPFSPSADGESAICPPTPPSEDLCIPIKSSNGKIAQVCL